MARCVVTWSHGRKNSIVFRLCWLICFTCLATNASTESLLSEDHRSMAQSCQPLECHHPSTQHWPAVGKPLEVLLDDCHPFLDLELGVMRSVCECVRVRPHSCQCSKQVVHLHSTLPPLPLHSLHISSTPTFFGIVHISRYGLSFCRLFLEGVLIWCVCVFGMDSVCEFASWCAEVLCGLSERTVCEALVAVGHDANTEASARLFITSTHRRRRTRRPST